MRIERTHGFDGYGLLLHHLIARDEDGRVIVALPRYPRDPVRWWNGAISKDDRQAIRVFLQAHPEESEDE